MGALYPQWAENHVFFKLRRILRGINDYFGGIRCKGSAESGQLQPPN